MPGTNDNNQGNDNSVFDLNAQTTVVSPDQTSMFAGPEAVTRMDIPHDVSSEQVNAPNVAEANPEPTGEGVSAATKFKIMATLVIVGIAGYAAYWVQEPVQLKTDVLNADSSTSTSAASATDSTQVADSGTSATPTDTSSAATTSSTTAAADSTASTPTSAAATTNVSVDVSLFGFNPATLAIDKGTTVTWTNTSTADQTIIGSAPDGESFASPVLTSGKSFSYKFDQDADFQYYSTYNPALKATIKVGAGSTAPAAVSTDTATTSAPADATATPPTTTTSSATTDTGATNSAADNLGMGGPDLSAAAAASATNTNLAYANEMATTTSVSTPADQLYPAASTQIVPKKLSKTGPAEDLYAVILLGVAWLNRKKLARVFKK